MYPNTIYLDRNVFIYAADGSHPEVIKVIERCKKNGKIFPYSPAHMEEIVKAIVDGRSECENDINYIRELSGEFAFHPQETGDTLLCYYPVKKCRFNVEKNDGRAQTEFAVDIDTIQKEQEKTIRENNAKLDKIRRHCSHLTPEEIFSNKEILQYLQLINIEQPKEGHRFSFRERERLIETLYKTLDFFGFRPENSHIENRMHDISHIIYASSAEILVSNDKNLINKAKAIFHFLSIPTKVMSLSEFLTAF